MKFETVSGNSIHPIGIGTWGFGGKREAEYDQDRQGVEAIRYSIAKGQNHIDSAEVYGAGHTDEIIGQAIEGLPRKDLYIVNKIWKSNVGKGKVRPAVEAMLERLGTNYLDVLYIHYPVDQEGPWKEAIPQIGELITEGIVRQFGMSNATLSDLEQATKLSRYPVAAVQLHYSVLQKQEVPKELQAFCRDKDMQIVAWLPLERNDVSEDSTVQAIARAHQATPVQVALAWLIHHHSLPIPKATKKTHIDENFAAVDLKLTPEETRLLDAL